MSQKKTTTKGGMKGKAEGSEEVTAERVRAFLENPDVAESAKSRVRKLVGELYQAFGWDTLPETPDYYGLLFEQTKYHRHAANGTLEDAEREIYAKLAEVVNRHEPKDARLIRRLSEMLQDPKTDGKKVGTLLETVTDMSNEMRIHESHPEIFETFARVLIREARKAAAVKVGRGEKARQEWLERAAKKGRRALTFRPWMMAEYLRELEEIAGK